MQHLRSPTVPCLGHFQRSGSRVAHVQRVHQGTSQGDRQENRLMHLCGGCGHDTFICQMDGRVGCSSVNCPNYLESVWEPGIGNVCIGRHSKAELDAERTLRKR